MIINSYPRGLQDSAPTRQLVPAYRTYRTVPAGLLGRFLAVVRSWSSSAEGGQPAKRRYPDRRASFAENAAMSREMYRL